MGVGVGGDGTSQVSSRSTSPPLRKRTVTIWAPGRSLPTTNEIEKLPSTATLPPLTARGPKYSKNAAFGGPSPVISTGSPGTQASLLTNVGVTSIDSIGASS